MNTMLLKKKKGEALCSDLEKEGNVVLSEKCRIL